MFNSKNPAEHSAGTLYEMPNLKIITKGGDGE